jgi:hypothetical protein
MGHVCDRGWLAHFRIHLWPPGAHTEPGLSGEKRQAEKDRHQGRFRGASQWAWPTTLLCHAAFLFESFRVISSQVVMDPPSACGLSNGNGIVLETDLLGVSGICLSRVPPQPS